MKQKTRTKEEEVGRPGRSKSYYISLAALEIARGLTTGKKTESRAISTIVERYGALTEAETPDLTDGEWRELDIVLAGLSFESAGAIGRLDEVIRPYTVPSLVARVRRLTIAQRFAVVDLAERRRAAIARGEKVGPVRTMSRPVQGVRLAARA